MEGKILFNTSLLLILCGINLLPVQAQKKPTNRDNPNKDNNQSYIGLRYHPVNPGQYLDYPRGIEYLGGWSIDDLRYPNPSVYGISRIKKGNQEMLWFEMVVDRDRTGNPSKWLVLDVFHVPKIDKSSTFVSSCQRNGVGEPGIIAIAKLQNFQDLRQIQKAWRANKKTRKFEEISTKGIVCQNLDVYP